MPDLTKVGYYYFTINYKGYIQSYYLEVYDSSDTSIKNIHFQTNSNIVFNYTINDGIVNIIENIDGNYIYVNRANKKEEVIKITQDMISYDIDAVKQNILNNTDNFVTTTLTLSYEETTVYGNIVFVNLSDMDTIATQSNISLYKNGSNVSKIKVEKDAEINDYYLEYAYYGYSYYLKIEGKDILNENNEVQTTSVAGYYNVKINNYSTILFVYDKADAHVDFYAYKTVQISESSTAEDLKNALLGKEVYFYASYNYDGNYESESDSIIISQDNIADLSNIDLTTVGSVQIPLSYNGYNGFIRIQVIPDVTGQTSIEYTYTNEEETTKLYLYNNYLTDGKSWYKYELIDEENSVILAYIFQGKMFKIDYSNKTLIDFKGEDILNALEKEYAFNYSGQILTVKVYNDIYADIYSYNDEKLEYNGTFQVVKSEEDNSSYYYVNSMNLKLLIDDVNHTLTQTVNGKLVYSYETTQEGQQIKAEFREEDGEKLMYYYTFNTETNNYELLGNLTWNINEEHTLINCYTEMGGQQYEVIRFTVENEEITGMQEVD